MRLFVDLTFDQLLAWADREYIDSGHDNSISHFLPQLICADDIARYGEEESSLSTGAILYDVSITSDVKGAILRVIGSMRQDFRRPWFLSVLMMGLTVSDLYVRYQSVLALADYGGQEAVEALQAALAYEASVLVRDAILEALEGLQEGVADAPTT